MTQLYPAVVLVEGGMKRPVKFSDSELIRIRRIVTDHRCTGLGVNASNIVHYYIMIWYLIVYNQLDTIYEQTLITPKFKCIGACQ